MPAPQTTALKSQHPFDRLEPRILDLVYDHHVECGRTVGTALADLIEGAILEVPVAALPDLKVHIGQLVGVLFAKCEDDPDGSLERRLGHLAASRQRLTTALDAAIASEVALSA